MKSKIEVIRLRELAKQLNVSKSGLYRLRRKDESFPKPITYGGRSVFFFVKEVDEWMNSREQLSY
jgi:prophage regulatory protein